METYDPDGLTDDLTRSSSGKLYVSAGTLVWSGVRPSSDGGTPILHRRELFERRSEGLVERSVH